jgi:hypothetical protein
MSNNGSHRGVPLARLTPYEVRTFLWPMMGGQPDDSRLAELRGLDGAALKELDELDLRRMCSRLHILQVESLLRSIELYDQSDVIIDDSGQEPPLIYELTDIHQDYPFAPDRLTPSNLIVPFGRSGPLSLDPTKRPNTLFSEPPQPDRPGSRVEPPAGP